MVNVLLFAGLAEKLGQQKLVLDTERKSVSELLTLLTERYPQIETDLDHVMIAVNEEFVSKDTIVHSHDTVALIPPVSGG
ncbi:MAG: molybdopterin converting factor subunit 1 [Bacilli bacterium]